MSAMTQTMMSGLWVAFLPHILIDLGAIALGLAIFFGGRAHVRKKYGKR